MQWAGLALSNGSWQSLPLDQVGSRWLSPQTHQLLRGCPLST